MGLWSDLRAARRKAEARDIGPLSLDDWASYFSFGGMGQPLQLQQTLGGNTEQIGRDFAGLVRGAYKSNGVVFACMAVRLRLFSEARFQFQRLKDSRPGDLFGTSELGILETPWPGGTTGDLLARAIQDADIAGNFFCTRRGDVIRRLRPDWMSIVLGSQTDPSIDMYDIDAEVIGYIYHPGGIHSSKEPEALTVDEVAHFAPTPDPMASFRGMSWLTPVLQEIMADSSMTTHKRMFMDNGATPNMVVKLDANVSQEAFDAWVKLFQDKHEGVLNAYKTLFLGGGADATVVGANMRQIDFKATQGHGETRIAAAAGVPAIIVGLSEGLDAATYSNFGQARRALADTTMRPLWRNFAGSMQRIVNMPGKDTRLWYDDRDIGFLREDNTDAASIHQIEAQSIRTLIDSGFEAQSAIDAVVSGDFSKLKHTGLFSVQLQAPGSTKMPQGEVPGELPVAGGTVPETPPVNPAGNGKPAPAKVPA